MQTAVKYAYLRTLKEEGMDMCMSPYYRDFYLGTNLGKPEDDPTHCFAIVEEVLADLGRFEGGI